MSSTNLKRHYHRTQQYRVIALTDSLGAIKERTDYDVYGGFSSGDPAAYLDGAGTLASSPVRPRSG